MIYVSLAFVLAAIALAVWPRRRRGAGADADALQAADAWVPLDQRAAMPLALSYDRIRRYQGPLPSLFAFVATTVAAAAFGFAMIGVAGALIMAIAAAVTLRVSSARPLLTVGGPAILVATIGWLLVRQLLENLPPGFDWPTYFEGAQAPAWLAVLFLLLDVVVDRCWLRRWWASPPTED